VPKNNDSKRRPGTVCVTITAEEWGYRRHRGGRNSLAG
jgi:hypothetical protein